MLLGTGGAIYQGHEETERQVIQTLCRRPGANLLSEGIGPLGAGSAAEEDGSLLQELRSESYWTYLLGHLCGSLTGSGKSLELSWFSRDC